MTDPIIGVPETQIDDHTTVLHVVDESASDINFEITPPADTLGVEEVEASLPGELETATSDVAEVAEEPITVASDVAPTPAEKTLVKDTTIRTPDVMPKRKLGWRGYILGGSGGTK